MTAAPVFKPDDFVADANTLHPALRMYLCESRVLGTMLKHPLVCQVPFYSSNFANQQFERKLEIVQEHLRKREYHMALHIYERYHRLPQVYQWFRAGKLNLPMLRRLLKFAWPDTEDPPYEDCLEMFLTAGYTSDTRKKLKGVLTLYRGDSKRRHNMEWSLQRKTAEWFARRWWCKTPWVATTQIDASSVLAYFVGRGEAEVIVHPKTLGKVKYERILPLPANQLR